jgi:uncharacterized membrane protein YkoI
VNQPDREEAIMQTRTRLIVISALVLTAAGGATAAIAASAGDPETPLRGATLDRAGAAAVEHLGGGTVLEAEVGDGGEAYEVEVRRDDGTVVEVYLDDSFAVTGSSADDDSGGTDDE